MPTEPIAPREETFVDADGVTVHVWRWDAEAPRGLVHIGHGVGEHALRWAPLAERLAAAGYDVAANDQRGHGRTGSGHLGLGDLGPRSTRAAIDSMQAVGERLRAERPRLPLILLGHSWGSLMAQRIIARAPLYDGAILSGTSLAVPGVLNAGDLNRPWRSEGGTGLQWLSRDEAVQAAFAEDPLTFDIAETPAWRPHQALAFLGRPPRHLPGDPAILIIGGAADTLGGERGMRALYAAYRQRSGATDVTLRLYDGARHEIFNETNREEAIADVIAWLHARTAPAGRGTVG